MLVKLSLLDKLCDGRNDIILNTPNRAEILKAGPPKNARCNILGKGAFGTVFKAIFQDKKVAVKIMRNASAINIQAIRNEAQILGWHHRNIVQIIKVESTPNFGIVIMERFYGRSLYDILDSIELILPHRINITLDVLSALSHCHKRGLVHLDIKPQNIYITFNCHNLIGSSWCTRRQYICKLCDFGSSLYLIQQDLSTHCSKNIVRGTIRYMSPEMIRGTIPTPASDIFSLGITMWQMMERCMPYSWIDYNDVVAYQVTKHNLRPDVSTKLSETRESVGQRYKDCLKQFRAQAPKSNCRPFQLRKRWRQVDITNDFLLSPDIRSIETFDDSWTNWMSIAFGVSSNYVRCAVKETAYKRCYQCCWENDPSVRPNSQQLFASLWRLC